MTELNWTDFIFDCAGSLLLRGLSLVMGGCSLAMGHGLLICIVNLFTL